MWWRSRKKSWRENKMQLQTKKTCCSKTWVFLFKSSAGVLHWHERCPNWPSRFSMSYQSTCIWKYSQPERPPMTSCKESTCFWWWHKNTKLWKFVLHYFFFGLLMYEKRWKDACQSAFLSWKWRSYTPNGWFKIPPNQKTNFNSEVNG